MGEMFSLEGIELRQNRVSTTHEGASRACPLREPIPTTGSASEHGMHGCRHYLQFSGGLPKLLIGPHAAMTFSEAFRLALDLRLATISTSRSNTFSIWINRSVENRERRPRMSKETSGCFRPSSWAAAIWVRPRFLMIR